MHELTLMMNIIDIAEEQVKKAHAHQIDSIELEIGSLAGVEMGALDFAWQSAVHNTVLEKAERTINNIQAIAKCPNCEYEYPVMDLFDPCPVCQEILKDYLQGKELKVKSLVVS